MLLKSERIILRPFTMDDAEDLYEYLSDVDVVKFEPYNTYTREMAYEAAKARTDNSAFIAVCLKENDKLIGNLYFNRIEPEKINTYELGYVFNKRFHGRGYATEAAECLLMYIFSTLKAHRVIACCNTENTSSWKLLERLKFRREAERIKNMFFDVNEDGKPMWFNSYQYALLRHEYNER